jgi:uncharacterized membrane protein YjgN (DUF898 family)
VKPKTSKFLINVVAMTIAASLLGLHHFTQHYAWLYLFGVIVSLGSILVTVVFAFLFLLYIFVDIDNKLKRKLATNDDITTLPIVVTLVIPILIMSYLLYVESYFLATIYLYSVIVASSMNRFLSWIQEEGRKLLREEIDYTQISV